MNNEKTRIIQELVPGKQITIAHIIANPDEILYQKLGLDPAKEHSGAIGIVTMSPSETAIIAGDIAIKCDVDKNSTYAQARQRIKQLSESLSEEYKIAFIADCFDYEVKSGYPIEKDGIFYMPSVAYKNPV